MLSFLRMAFRNLIRHKRRTLITGLMIFFGSFFIIFLLAYGYSFNQSFGEAVSESLTGDLQIHTAGEDEEDISFLISPEQVKEIALSKTEVEAISSRIEYFGSLSTGEEERFVEIKGIEPDKETKINSRLEAVKGEWLSPGGDEILISQDIADELNIEPGAELIIMTNTPAGYLNGIALETAGIVGAEGMDLFLTDSIFIDISSLRELLFLEENEIEYLILGLADGVSQQDTTAILENEFAASGFNLNIKGWQDIDAPYSGMSLLNRLVPGIVLVIILIIAAVGIINTVLMSVMERKKEIGTLTAMGTSSREVIWLFLLEALILGLIAAGAGLLLALGIIFFLSWYGLPAYGMMEMLYGGDRLYFSFNWREIISAFLVIVLVSGGAAFFPARKAVKMNPVAALREKE